MLKKWVNILNVFIKLKHDYLFQFDIDKLFIAKKTIRVTSSDLVIVKKSNVMKIKARDEW